MWAGPSVRVVLLGRPVLDSNLHRGTGYFLAFLVIFLSPYRQILGEYHDYAMTASFQIPSNSSSVILPVDAIYSESRKIIIICLF
jgi:hypothetical protein